MIFLRSTSSSSLLAFRGFASAWGFAVGKAGCCCGVFFIVHRPGVWQLELRTPHCLSASPSPTRHRRQECGGQGHSCQPLFIPRRLRVAKDHGMSIHTGDQQLHDNCFQGRRGARQDRRRRLFRQKSGIAGELTKDFLIHADFSRSRRVANSRLHSPHSTANTASEQRRSL